MQRKLLVSIHLYLAAFFTPLVLIMAISGGLYLLGVKGSVDKNTVTTVAGEQLNLMPGEEQARVTELLRKAGIDADFDYVKNAGPAVITRPTHQTYYELKDSADGVVVSRMQPDLMASLMELHKGHGPQIFRVFEMLFALGLVFIMLSGLYLGLQSPLLKKKTLLLSGSGLLVFVVLAAL